MHLAVADTGLGVSAGTEADILKPFFTTKTHGMGMGLSICRTIVEAHRGRLVATARIPYGASFTFDLPWVAVGPVIKFTASTMSQTHGSQIVPWQSYCTSLWKAKG